MRWQILREIKDFVPVSTFFVAWCLATDKCLGKKLLALFVTMMGKVFYFDTCVLRWQLFLLLPSIFVPKLFLFVLIQFTCGKPILTFRITNFRHHFFGHVSFCLYQIASRASKLNQQTREPAVKVRCFFPPSARVTCGKSTTWHHEIFCQSDVIQRKSWLRFFPCDYQLNDSNNKLLLTLNRTTHSFVVFFLLSFIWVRHSKNTRKIGFACKKHTWSIISAPEIEPSVI